MKTRLLRSSVPRLALIANSFLLGCSFAAEPDWVAARQRMVTDQLAGRDITNQQVLQVMRTVPRHELVPDSQRRQSYKDRPLPIGHGQTVSQRSARLENNAYP